MAPVDGQAGCIGTGSRPLLCNPFNLNTFVGEEMWF